MLYHLITSGVEHPPPAPIDTKQSVSNEAESPEVPLLSPNLSRMTPELNRLHAVKRNSQAENKIQPCSEMI